MSQSLRWRPVDGGKSLPDELKRVMQDNFLFNGGELSLHGEEISFIKGLSAAGTRGAKELLSAIEKHGEIVIWIE